jgi:hypothetical protein
MRREDAAASYRIKGKRMRLVKSVGRDNAGDSSESRRETRASAAKSVERGKERDSLESLLKRRVKNFRNVARHNAGAVSGEKFYIAAEKIGTILACSLT